MDVMKVVSNIVIGIIGTALTMMVAWMVREVASLSEVKVEMKHMNKNLAQVNETMKEGNNRLEQFNKYHTQNLAIISKAIAVNTNEISNLERRCNHNEREIDKCRDSHYTNGDK